MKFYNSISRPALSGIILFAILLSGAQLRAQVSTSSPYSRYGIGDLQFGGFTKNQALGGLSFALNQPYNINFSNPASYSSIALTTFEAGANANFIQLKSTSGTGYVHDASLGYMAFAFPVINKKWGASFGLLPYTNVGYNIASSDTNEAGDTRQHLYEGDGGLNQFYLGNAWSPTKNFSVGMNASFLFGTINQVRKIYFPGGGYLNTRVTDASVINDFYFSFGIQQTFDSIAIAKSDSVVMLEKEKSPRNDSLLKTVLRKKQKSHWSVTIGATVAPSMKLKGTHSLLAENYLMSAGEEIVRDTALNTDVKNQKLVLPLSVGIGFAAKKGSRWLLGSDFSLQNWQDYSLFGLSDSLANSWRIAAGMQWIPNDRSVKSYFNTVQYRIGIHYEQTYLQIHNSQLNQMGVSLGFGLPIKRAATMIHFSVEAGKRGTTSDKLIEENYFKCSLGFSLSDRWFVKPKFD